MEKLQKIATSKPVLWPVILATVACFSVLLNITQFIGSFEERPRTNYFNEYLDARNENARLSLEKDRLVSRNLELEDQLEMWRRMSEIVRIDLNRRHYRIVQPTRALTLRLSGRRPPRR